MNNISSSVKKLLQLIRREFEGECVAPWGMQEYDDYESQYLEPLEKNEQVEVFKSAYSVIEPEEIPSLFYLASAYAVPLHNKYFNSFFFKLQYFTFLLGKREVETPEGSEKTSSK